MKGKMNILDNTKLVMHGEDMDVLVIENIVLTIKHGVGRFMTSSVSLSVIQGVI